MIHTQFPLNTVVQFRTSPAHHYQWGRVVGRSVHRGRAFYDIRDHEDHLHTNLTDLKGVCDTFGHEPEDSEFTRLVQQFDGSYQV